MNYRQIQFCTRPDQIDLSQLQELFSLTAVWAQERGLEDLKIAITNSDPVVSVWDRNKMKRKNLSFYIWNVLSALP